MPARSSGDRGSLLCRHRFAPGSPGFESGDSRDTNVATGGGGHVSQVDAGPGATGDRIAAMTSPGPLVASASLARSPAYDVVLLAHVLPP